MNAEYWCLLVGAAATLGTLSGYAMGRAFGRREGWQERARYEARLRTPRDEFGYADPDNEED